MKILVTGGSGFIGSAVVRLAISRGHSVVNVDALTYAASLESISDVLTNPNYYFENNDIRDGSALDRIFINHKPDAVIHLAAESHVDRSIDSPSEFIHTNINGTFNMLEAARRFWRTCTKPKNFRFLHVSTDEVFGSLPVASSALFSESTPYAPRSPYSASKASSDHLVRAWYETYGLPILLTNCSNNYGPYQFPEKLVPVIILNSLLERSLPIYGDGNNVRDWLYVEDHADAILLVLENGVIGRSYNIGGKNERSNVEVVRTICSILDRLKPRSKGSYTELIAFVKDRPGHDERYAIDPSRIEEELGWKPTVTFAQGLEKTVQWYIDNKDWSSCVKYRSKVAERLGALD